MFSDSDSPLVTQLLGLPASERTLALERACTEDPNVIAIASNRKVRKVRMLVAAAYLEEKNEDAARRLLQRSRDEASAQLAKHPGVVDTSNDLGLAIGMLHDYSGGQDKLAQARDLMKLGPFEQNAREWYENALRRAWVGEKHESLAKLKKLLQSQNRTGLG